jgi:hypothetical protein
MAAQYLALETKNDATKILEQEQMAKAGCCNKYDETFSVLIVGETTMCEVT